MKIETIKKMAADLKPGEKMTILTTKKPDLEKLFSEQGLSIVDDYMDHDDILVVRKTKKAGEKSRYALIIDVLQSYKTGSIEIQGETSSYVRTVSSQYNQRTGKKFKVTEVNGEPQVYLEIEDRDHITEQEMSMIRAKYNTNIQEMELKVKPSDFFGENEYTEPESTIEDDHASDDGII